MAVILPFPGCRVPPRPAPMSNLPEPFTVEWQAENLPLVDQAIGLLQVDDAELRRRCRAMASRGGRTLLDELSAQIDNLGSHIADVAVALSLAALRIRGTMTTLQA